MIPLIEVMLKRDSHVPTATPPKLFVNPEDVSHILVDEHGYTHLSFRNGKTYRTFEGADTLK